MLIGKIENIFARYDPNGTGHLEQNEFFAFFNELCVEMNVPPPQSYEAILNVAREVDTNYDGRISKQ